MLKHLILGFCVLAFAAGCSPRYNAAKTPFAIYKPISEDDVRKLEKGITPPADVIRLFGEPTKNSISDRGERYTYGYLGDTLTVNFDSSLTVNNFLYRPTVFAPVTGNADYTNRKISESAVQKIRIYEDNIGKLENKFRKANKKETSLNRNRYTFDRRNGTLVVYTLANYEERVLSYSFTKK